MYLHYMTAFWDIAPCSLVEVDDVSEVHTASIIRAMNYGVLQREYRAAYSLP
jgi:hypothetical protein